MSQGYPENLKQFQEWYDKNKDKIPKELFVERGITIIDVHEMVKTHIKILHAQRGKNVFVPYWLRLKQIYNLVANDL